MVAKTLFHTPGSLLAADEIEKIYSSSGCMELLTTPNCDPSSKFRTIDGTCNNLANPTQGAAGTPFRRMLPAHYEDGISSIRGEIQHYGNILKIGPFDAPIPSARLISHSIVLDKPFDELQATHMLMQFGQYLEHDVTRTAGLLGNGDCVGCQNTDTCLPIFVPSDDPDFGIGTFRNGSCLIFLRNTPACTNDPPGTFGPRQQINTFTAYVDGSVIYGSDKETAKSLRDVTGGGRLRTGFTLPNNTKPSLPLAIDGKEFTAGDSMVILQPGLVAMATIWMREHNRVAALLASLNPNWDEDHLYEEARKIVGAEFQRVSYFEFLPVLLGNDTYNALIGPYRGYNPNADASLPTELTTAAFRMGHSLFRPSLSRLQDDYVTSIPAGEQPLELFGSVDIYTKSLGTDPLLRGLLTAPARRRDEYVINFLTTKLFEEAGKPGSGSDLISLTIQRGRDHGLPPYPIVRNFCKSRYNISSPLEHQLTFIRLLQNYGSLDSTDLWVGGDAEQRLPGSILGATFACIFGNGFANLRDGDRFYFESPEVFTPQQLAEINKASLSKIICDNSDGITRIQRNAFLANQPRVPCSDLPSLDLISAQSPWREQAVSNNSLLKQLENDLQSLMSMQD